MLSLLSCLTGYHLGGEFMICKSNAFAGVNEQDKRWTNWNGSVQFIAEEYFEPTGLLDLVYVVSRATSENKKLRAIGSGWSFEDIAKSDDWVINLKNLKRRLENVVGNG